MLSHSDRFKPDKSSECARARAAGRWRSRPRRDPASGAPLLCPAGTPRSGSARMPTPPPLAPRRPRSDGDQGRHHRRRRREWVHRVVVRGQLGLPRGPHRHRVCVAVQLDRCAVGAGLRPRWRGAGFRAADGAHSALGARPQSRAPPRARAPTRPHAPAPPPHQTRTARWCAPWTPRAHPAPTSSAPTSPGGTRGPAAGWRCGGRGRGAGGVRSCLLLPRPSAHAHTHAHTRHTRSPRPQPKLSGIWVCPRQPDVDASRLDLSILSPSGDASFTLGADGSGEDLTPIGWVSHFGDAARRMTVTRTEGTTGVSGDGGWCAARARAGGGRGALAGAGRPEACARLAGLAHNPCPPRPPPPKGTPFSRKVRPRRATTRRGACASSSRSCGASAG